MIEEFKTEVVEMYRKTLKTGRVGTLVEDREPVESVSIVFTLPAAVPNSAADNMMMMAANEFIKLKGIDIDTKNFKKIIETENKFEKNADFKKVTEIFDYILQTIHELHFNRVQIYMSKTLAWAIEEEGAGEELESFELSVVPNRYLQGYDIVIVSDAGVERTENINLVRTSPDENDNHDVYKCVLTLGSEIEVMNPSCVYVCKCKI